MNSKRTANLYQLSEQLEKEEQDYWQQAKKIVNAYRNVEQLKLPKPKLIASTLLREDPNKHKHTSNYALKVKQTISLIKAKQFKEMQHLGKHIHHGTVKEEQSGQHNKLKRVGVFQIVACLDKYQLRMVRLGLVSVRRAVEEDDKRENQFIVKFRKFKIFRAWKDEIALRKLQRQRTQAEDRTAQAQSTELAQQFRTYALIKKSLKGWDQVTRREIKRKAYEEQLRRMEQEKKERQMLPRKEKKKEEVSRNPELQNKLQGFISGLKDKIEHKDRLITIKENTEQSDPHTKYTQPNLQEPDEEMQAQEEGSQNSREDDSPDQMQEIVIRPPSHQPAAVKKLMTNEQLQARRQQLEEKHKNRRSGLEKLKRQKDEKKKEEEKLRAELQKEVEEEQKKIKQEKYRQFVKNKQEQQSWEQREKQLQILAYQFNARRLMKYYGWLPLLNLKSVKQQKTQTLYQTILLIVFRVKATAFIKKIEQNCHQILQNQNQQMSQRYNRILITRSWRNIEENRQNKLEEKEQLQIRHEVHQMGVYFAEWKRVQPQLMGENFDWERPRRKRAEEFYRVQLLQKGLEALQENKVQEQRSRIVSEQKKKIKSRINDMMGESEDFDIEQFL